MQEISQLASQEGFCSESVRNNATRLSKHFL